MDYNQIIQMLMGGGMMHGGPMAQPAQPQPQHMPGPGGMMGLIGGPLMGQNGAMGNSMVAGPMAGMMGGAAPGMAMSAVPPDLIKKLVHRIFG